MTATLWDPYAGRSSGGGSTGAASVQSVAQADNSTPLGRGIPLGIGSCAFKGEILVDIDQIGGVRLVNGRYRANIIVGFAVNDLGGDWTLVRLKANDQIVFSAKDPVRALGTTMRFYGGGQTAVDPIVTQYLDAKYRTMWPTMAYIVFEDFDITAYSDGSDIPVFVAELATSATVSGGSEGFGTQTFGPYASGDRSRLIAVDWQLRETYHLVQLDDDSYMIGTYTLEGVETRRVAVTGPEAFSYIGTFSALSGSGHILARCTFSGLDGYALIDTLTGEMVSIFHAVSNGFGDYFESGDVLITRQVRSDRSSVYIALAASTFFMSVLPKSHYGWCLAIDVTNKTITAVNGPASNPVPVAVPSSLAYTNFSILAAGDVSNGQFLIYMVNEAMTVWQQATVSESGVSDVVDLPSMPDATSTVISAVYDARNEAIVYTRTGDDLVSAAIAYGSEIYRVDLSVLDGARPSDPYIITSEGDSWQSGFSGLYISNVSGWGEKRYTVDLSSGDTSLIFGQPRYYSQYEGIGLAASDSTDITEIGVPYVSINQVVTPGVVDAEDILAALATFKGDYDASDLVFTGFVGGECYGYPINSDTTVDECIRDVCQTLGIRQYHDAGKWHFIMPRRNGDFSVDAVLLPDDITLERIRQRTSDTEASIRDCHLTYIDLDADYNQVTQSHIRPTGVFDTARSGRVDRISTNLVMSAPQAARSAWRLAYESEFDRTSYSLELMPRQARIVPSDYVQFPFGSRTVTGEVRKTVLDTGDFSQKVDVTQAMQYQESASLGSGLVTVAPTNALPARMVVLDTALISSSDDMAGSGLRGYVAFLGQDDANIQTHVAYKSANGTDYLAFGGRGGIAPVWGTVSSISRNRDDGFATDYAGSLSFVKIGGLAADLATISEAQAYQNVNIAAVGAPGRWVLIAYQGVSISGYTITLSEIIWGWGGTEIYLDDLQAGDLFINLDSSEYLRYSSQASALGSSEYLKGGHSSYLVSQLVTVAQVADGEAEKPFAPVNVAYSDAGSTRTITWDYRERLSIVPVLLGAQSAGYSETVLAFEADLLDGSGNVLATLETATGSVGYDTGTYAAASAKIYQMGLGGTLRGHAATLTF